MLAPEPFFEPRGTPFSEYHRIRALCELGYRVDLVTYPFGRDVRIPRLEIFRCPRPPFVRGVRIGPSGVKILLDLLLAVTAARLARTRRYDAIHSHEEAGVLGLWLAKRFARAPPVRHALQPAPAARQLVATDLRTHTQVLDAGTALLVPPVIRPGAKGLATI